MSYSSENLLGPKARIKDVRDFVKILGYQKHGVWTSERRKFEDYVWFESADYKSWSGVELTIYKSLSGALAVSTRTTVSRSYYDLEQQNSTISTLLKYFGGTFKTDEGARRYLRPQGNPPTPAASGCHLAFVRFGSNLIRAIQYLQENARAHTAPTNALLVTLGLDHRTLSSNMLNAFCVSIVEDYLKSCFIALLKYSEKKETFFRSARLHADSLARIANREMNFEEAIAESMSFQKISSACRNLANIDASLDIASVLRKPYRRRAQSFFDQLSEMVDRRHRFVHRAEADRTLSYQGLRELLYDLDEAMTRVQRKICDANGWAFEKTWGIGRRSAKTGKTGVALPLPDEDKKP